MNAAELAKLIKGHNEAHPQRKVSQHSAREAYRRGVADFTNYTAINAVPTPVQGASPHACGERRLAEFLRVSAGDSAPTGFGDVDWSLISASCIGVLPQSTRRAQSS